jgi:AcrR family transcriptional regulator
VFQQFGSKAGLLQAVEEATSLRAGVDGLQVALADADALRSLRAAFEVGCQVWAAEREMFRNLFSLAVIDPQMREIMAHKDQHRRQLVDALAQKLQRQKHLRAGITRRHAADLLWLLTSFETFDTLFAVRGSVKEVARLLLSQVTAFIAT